LTGKGGPPREYTDLYGKTPKPTPPIVEKIQRFAYNWILDMKHRPGYKTSEYRRNVWGNGLRNTIGKRFAMLHYKAKTGRDVPKEVATAIDALKSI